MNVPLLNQDAQTTLTYPDFRPRKLGEKKRGRLASLENTLLKETMPACEIF